MAGSDSIQDFQMTDFPPELIVKFLPDFEPKTISQMRLVCRRFFHIFNSDLYYKAYLVYPEEDFESDLKFESPAKGIKEIVDEIKHGECGKWEGYLKLQKAHMENLRCGRLDSFDVVHVDGSSIQEYFEGSDSQNGRWLICRFVGGQVTFVNLVTKERLDITISNCTSVHFKHDIVIFVLGDGREYAVYRLSAEGEKHTLKHIRTSITETLLDPDYPVPGTRRQFMFYIGILPSVVITFTVSNGEVRPSTVHFVVFDVETSRVTHACPIGVSDDGSTAEVVMPNPSILHVRISNSVVKSFKLHPSPAEDLGKVECFWTLDRLQIFQNPFAPSRMFYGDVRGYPFYNCSLYPRCLVWQQSDIVSVFKMKDDVIQEEACTFPVFPISCAVGFLSPNIVLINCLETAPNRMFATCPEENTYRINVQALHVNGRGPSLFMLNPLSTQHLCFDKQDFGFSRWVYPARKVLLSNKRGDHYTFNIHYF